MPDSRLYARGNHIRSEPETVAPTSRYRFEDCKLCCGKSTTTSSLCHACDEASLFTPSTLDEVRNRPENRPEVTTGHYGEPMEQEFKYRNCPTCQFYGNKKVNDKNPDYCSCEKWCVNDEYIESRKKSVIENSATQTFDSLIMECQDTLSIETEIDKRFKEWASNRNPNKFYFIAERYKMPLFLSLVVVCAVILAYDTGDPFIYESQTPPRAVAVIKWAASIIFGGASAAFLFVNRPIIKTNFSQWFPLQFFPDHGKNPSEASKFEFLRTAYVGTIDKLNSRLFSVKDKIDQQIKEHEKDELEISKYQDLFEDTAEPVKKIKEAIQSLKDSREKISTKQKEINDVLNEYTGENGYISQKEKEIERIKKAQEISDRMKHNFKTTLEITASVDVLSDTIIPGLKKIMSFKIPELIDKVNYECKVG